MALEQFTVDLEVELSKFLDSISTASDGLNSLSEQAAQAGKEISASLGKTDITGGLNSKALDSFSIALDNATQSANNFSSGSEKTQRSMDGIKDSSTGLETAGSILSIFGKTIATFIITAAGLGATLVIFKTLNFALKDFLNVLASGGDTGAVSNFTKSLFTAANGAARLAANIPGLPPALKKTLTSLDRVTQGAGNLTRGFSNLALENENIVTGAANVSRSFDKADDAVRAFFSRIPGGEELFNSINENIDKFGRATDKIIPKVGKAAEKVGGFSGTVAEASQGVSKFIPGLRKATKTAIELGEAGTVASVGLSAMGFEASALAGASNFLLGTVIGINAAIIAFGVAIGVAGKKLVTLGVNLANDASKLSLLQKQLETTVKNAKEFGTTLDEDVGSFEDFAEGIDNIRKETGVFTGDITRVVTGLLQIQEQTGFTTEEILALAKNTVLLGKKFDDIPRAVAAVVGAFNNQAVAIRGLSGANTTVTNTETKLNELLKEGGETRDRLAKSTESQKNALARLNIILASTANIADAVAESQDNLQIANRKLENAVKEARAEIGEFTEGALVPLTNALTKAVNVIVELPDGLQAVIGNFISLGGIALTVSGTLITIGGTVALLTTGLTILNGALGGTIVSLKFIGPVISKFASQMLGTEVVIKSVSGLLGALGQITVKSLSAAGAAFTNFSLKLITTDLAIKSTSTGIGFLGPIFTRLSADISNSKFAVDLFRAGMIDARGLASKFGTTLLGTGVKAVGSAAKFIGIQGTLIALGVSFISAAASTEFFTSILDIIVELLGGSDQAMKILKGTLNGLIFTFDILTSILKLGFEVVFTGVLTLLTAALGIVGGLATGIKALTGELLISDETLERLDKATTAAAVGMEKAGLAANKTADKIAFLSGASGTAAEQLDKVEKSAVKARKELDELTQNVSPELLAAALTEVEKAVNSLADTQITASNEVAAARIRDVESTIDSESERAKQIESITLELNNEIVASEKKRADQLLIVNNDKLTAAIAALNQEEKENKRTAQSITEERRSIALAAKAAEKDILTNLSASLKTQLEKVREFQDSRVGVIRDARDRIAGIEKDLSEFIFDNNLKITEDDEKNAKIREEIGVLQSKLTKARLAEDFEEARKVGARITDLAKQIGADPAIANAITASVKISSARTQEEFVKLVDIIDDAFTGDIPLSAQEAFDAFTREIDGTKEGTDRAKDRLGDVKDALEKIRDVNIAENQNAMAVEVAASLTEIETTAISVAQKESDAFEEAGNKIIEKINTVQESIQKLADEIPTILLDVEAVIDDGKLQDDIVNLESNTLIKLPAVVQIKDADIEGGSVHPLTEAGRVIGQVITPDPINTTLDITGVEDDFARIQKESLETGLQVSSTLSKAFDTAFDGLATRDIIAPPIQVLTAKVGSLTGPITKVAKTITDLISPTVNGEEILAGITIDEGVIIPGVGTVKVSGVAAKIRGTFTPGAAIEVATGFAPKVNLPGFGPVSLATAESELRKLMQPNAPVKVKVEVDEASLAKAKSQIAGFVGSGESEVGKSNSNTNRSGARTIPVTFNFSPVTANGLTFEQVGEKARAAVVGGIDKAGPIPVNFNTKLDQLKKDLAKNMERAMEEAVRIAGRANGVKRSFGDVFAAGALQARESFQRGLIGIEEDIEKALRRAELAEERRNKKPLTRSVVLDVGYINIEGGSLHKLTEAGAVINEVINPGAVVTNMDLMTRNAKKTFTNFAELASVIDTKIDTFIPSSELNSLVGQVQTQFNNSAINVNLKADGIDIKGGSFHPFGEAGAVISKLIKPNSLDISAAVRDISIPVVPNISPVGGNGIVGANGVGSSTPSQTVRVDLNINDKTFPVETTNKESADSLVKFSKELKLMTRTKGQSVSPFDRGASI